MRKHGLVLMAAFVACFAASTLSFGTPANGAILNSLMSFLPPGQTYYDQYMHDLDAERLIKGEGNQLEGILEEDDILEAVMVFNQINGLNMNLPNYELTAHINLLVLSKTPTGGTVTVAGQTFNTYDFDFGPVTPDVNGKGEMVWLYEDTTPDFRAQGVGVTLASAIANATDGTLVATLGLGTADYAADDLWEALNAPDAMSIFPLTNTSIAGATYDFGISVITNPGDVNIATDMTMNFVNGTLHDVVGTGQLFGKLGANTPFDFLTRTDINFTAAIPEAASVVIWGMLTVIGCVVIRRKP